MIRKPLDLSPDSNAIVVGRDNNGLWIIYGFLPDRVAIEVAENPDIWQTFFDKCDGQAIKKYYAILCGDYPRDITKKDLKIAAKFIKKTNDYDPRKLISHVSERAKMSPLVGKTPYYSNEDRARYARLPMISQHKISLFLAGKSKV